MSLPDDGWRVWLRGIWRGLFCYPNLFSISQVKNAATPMPIKKAFRNGGVNNTRSAQTKVTTSGQLPIIKSLSPCWCVWLPIKPLNDILRSHFPISGSGVSEDVRGSSRASAQISSILLAVAVHGRLRRCERTWSSAILSCRIFRACATSNSVSIFDLLSISPAPAARPGGLLIGFIGGSVPL